MLGDAYVLLVPAEYAGASSGSDDHPQQYCLHQFYAGLSGALQVAFTLSHTSPLSRQALSTFSDSFPVFLGPIFFELLLIYVTKKELPGDQRTSTLPLRGSCIRVGCVAALQLPC